MKILYFAWVRERIGRGEETIEIPSGVTTIGDLMSHLRQRGEGYAQAFARPEIIRAAVDHKHTAPSALIGAAREIAFFPPVTGG